MVRLRKYCLPYIMIIIWAFLVKRNFVTAWTPQRINANWIK
jgi:hypothetical protein